MMKDTVEIIPDGEVDVMQDGYVMQFVQGRHALRGNEKEVKRLARIIARARSGEVEACFELIDYGKNLKD